MNEFVIEISEAAIGDLKRIISWYHKKSAGLEDYIFENYIAARKKITANPFVLSKINTGGNIRRAVIKKFPYSIYYSLFGKKITIISLIHFSRSNAYKKRRLK